MDIQSMQCEIMVAFGRGGLRKRPLGDSKSAPSSMSINSHGVAHQVRCPWPTSTRGGCPPLVHHSNPAADLTFQRLSKAVRSCDVTLWDRLQNSGTVCVTADSHF